MKKRKAVTVLCLSMLAAGLCALAALAGRGHELKAGGSMGSITVGGAERTYLLLRPPGRDKNVPAPLVIALHGGGGNYSHLLEHSGLPEEAGNRGVLLAFPNGSGRHENRLLTWNAGNCCGHALGRKVDDVAFISALIDKLIAEENADPRRVYVTGMSNGAMMSYRLACELSEKIAAVAPVAGTMNVPCDPSEPVAMIVFNGDSDKHVLFEGGEPEVSIDRRHPRTDTPVPEAVGFWAQNNCCESGPDRGEKGAIIKESYSDCEAGAEVTLYIIKGGGHAWPGGTRPRPKADRPTAEISASALMLDFFLAHPKKGE